MRLRAAKKLLGNFSDVVNTGKRDFFSQGRAGRRGSGGLPKWNGGRETRKTESKEERKKLHRELARKSLGGRREKKKKKERRASQETAPQDMDN
jgi:hypothetical protein